MYHVFIVFTGGHHILINKWEFENTAIIEADYHHLWAKINDCHFEVAYKGDIVYSTDK